MRFVGEISVQKAKVMDKKNLPLEVPPNIVKEKDVPPNMRVFSPFALKKPEYFVCSYLKISKTLPTLGLLNLPNSGTLR